MVAALGLSLHATPLHAASTRCWIDQGVVVVAAEVAGAAGDYILDTGAPTTQLHETRAQSEGFATPVVTGKVRLAGITLAERPIAVVDLDARTYAFPTPVAGVIGADILAGHVLDVSFAPCRVSLWTKGREPRLAHGRALPLTMTAGRPLVAVGVADGVRAASGPFTPSTGLDAAVRLDAGQGMVLHGGKPETLLPYGPARARLRALSFAGELWENLPAGLVPSADLPPGALGEIGPEILAGWRLRFDVNAGRLWLAPRRAPPRW